ncbi:Hypothetical protein PHPALM_6436 [Phytophthora palmivora]|uniref:Uncharacterized protein n=1 Tax=Phytophthora palmivora TaxID=4796 RepID=A0A2P4YEX3_9STRA|nr:Hypothetical protein PHPALM_6436 [Phytophthora palmivora]
MRHHQETRELSSRCGITHRRFDSKKPNYCGELNARKKKLHELQRQLRQQHEHSKRHNKHGSKRWTWLRIWRGITVRCSNSKLSNSSRLNSNNNSSSSKLSNTSNFSNTSSSKHITSKCSNSSISSTISMSTISSTKPSFTSSRCSIKRFTITCS